MTATLLARREMIKEACERAASTPREALTVNDAGMMSASFSRGEEKGSVGPQISPLSSLKKMSAGVTIPDSPGRATDKAAPYARRYVSFAGN